MDFNHENESVSVCGAYDGSQDHFRVQSINVPGKKWPFLRFWSLDIPPAKGWHQCSVWRAWRLSDKKCPLSRRAFKGVRFCEGRRYWRSSHSLYSAPNFIAMTPRLYNILGAITISLYLAISKSGLHKLWTVLLSWADRGSCAPKCVS